MAMKNPYHARRASTLIGAYLKPLAKATAQQVREMVPRYNQVDQVALVRNIELILDATRGVLEQGDERRLMSVLTTIMDLRQAAGFTIRDFVVASLAGFPVARRFFIARSPDAVEGLRLFEAFECVMLPITGRIADTFSRLNEDSTTIPDGVSLSTMLNLAGLAESTESFEIAAVEYEG
ncbi:MAG: hypothetical protein ABIJ09_02500 [Pseudomonadota bacterium]